jgi:hypothetical protein
MSTENIECSVTNFTGSCKNGEGNGLFPVKCGEDFNGDEGRIYDRCGVVLPGCVVHNKVQTKNKSTV